MNETQKPSTVICNSLLHDMTHKRDADNHKVVQEAFNDDTTWEEGLEEREWKECEFAKKYALDFAHGTAGHNRLMLIAKLCEMLDIYEEALDRMIDMADNGRVS